MKKYYKNPGNKHNHQGIVLLVTLVILVILSMLGYTLSSRVMAQRLRNQYFIDYGKARYGCDSALKYSLAALKEIDPVLIERPDNPDFSDLYALDSFQYKEFLKQWEAEYKAIKKEKGIITNQTNESVNKLITNTVSDSNDTNDANDTETDDTERIFIPGPYGAQWPLITEPIEIEVGTAKVKIEIEDENAKYPLGWALVEDEKIQREIDAGFETFCEMSGLSYEQIDALKTDLKEIRIIRTFKMNFEPVITTKRETVKKTGTSSVPQVSRTVLTVATQISDQTTSFAKFFNSSLLDRVMLAKPTIVDDERKESPLKYISTWGTRQVNINTAPRHVLEAAFVFGGNQADIAEQVIQQRKIKPFQSIEDLQKKIFGFTDSIEKSKAYITTESTLFTIRITATSGMAKASTVIAVTKDGGGVKRIATISS